MASPQLMANHLAAEVSSSGTWNRGEVYAGGRHLATYSGGNSGTTYFDFTNWLGTKRVRTDPTKTTQETCTGFPFGDSQACSGTNVSPLGFTGQQYDSEDNLTSFPFREHEGTQGRWLTLDPAGLAAVNPGNPQSWNRYAYALNNPTGLFDPSGLDGCDWGDPISCVLTYGAYGGFGGAGLLGFSGPLSAGAVGNGGDDGWTFCCGDRNIVTAIYQTPGGAPRIRIAGPAQRVMSDVAMGSIGEAIFHGPGNRIWGDAAGTMNALTIGYAGVYAGVAGIAYTPGAVAWTAGRLYTIGSGMHNYPWVFSPTTGSFLPK
jgi:RHS repeat-associated protein